MGMDTGMGMDVDMSMGSEFTSCFSVKADARPTSSHQSHCSPDSQHRSMNRTRTHYHTAPDAHVHTHAHAHTVILQEKQTPKYKLMPQTLEDEHEKNRCFSQQKQKRPNKLWL